MRAKKPNPMDELLRARLRIPEGSDFKLAALRGAMRTIDFIGRTLGVLPFFALCEAEAMLIELDGRTGPELVDHIMAQKGGTQIDVHGLENIPTTGRVVIVSTHPIGTFDFIVHASALLRHRPDLMVVANREAERFLGKGRIIAVDLSKDEKVTSPRRTMEEMTAHLSQDGAILIFGSGRVPGQVDEYLKERPWRSGVTRVSAVTGAPIVPASTNMRNSKYYYRTRRWIGFLSGGNDDLGRNIASLRYVSELLAKLGGRYAVHYGTQLEPGTPAHVLQENAESLVPGLYRP